MPFLDFVGGDDVDDEVIAGADYAAEWGGYGGGTFAQLPDGDTVEIATTNVPGWAPGTGPWCVLAAVRRCLTDDGSGNQPFFGTGGAGEGLRMYERNGSALNRVHFQAESAVTTYTLTVENGPPLEARVYACASRIADDVHFWVRAEGSGDTFHTSVAVAPTDTFDTATALELFNSLIGNLEADGGVKAILYAQGVDAIGSSGVLDAFSGTATLVVTDV